MKPRIESLAGATTLAGAAPAHVLASGACLSVPVRRIATFHLNTLEGVLFALPALQALRESFPGATICAVMRPALAPLLQSSPFVDEILLRPKGGLSAQATLMAKLRAHHFDMALSFSPSRNTIMLMWSTGASVRAGFADASMDALLTHPVQRSGPPRIEHSLELVRAIGCATHQHDYSGLLHVDVSFEKRAQKILDERKIGNEFLIVACGANPNAKRSIADWPPAQWVSALKELSQRWPIILVGDHDSSEIALQLKHRKICDLSGRIDVATLAVLCGRARACCGHESGVLHLAAAMKTPVVAVFGPTDWRFREPRGVPLRIVRHAVECSPCELTKCLWGGADERKCLTRIEPNALVEAAHGLLGV